MQLIHQQSFWKWVICISLAPRDVTLTHKQNTRFLILISAACCIKTSTDANLSYFYIIKQNRLLKTCQTRHANPFVFLLGNEFPYWTIEEPKKNITEFLKEVICTGMPFCTRASVNMLGRGVMFWRPLPTSVVLENVPTKFLDPQPAISSLNTRLPNGTTAHWTW